METRLPQTPKGSTTCQLIQSRALCAVCGAPAIGRIQFYCFINKYLSFV
jgi:hypothetical protein